MSNIKEETCYRWVKAEEVTPLPNSDLYICEFESGEIRCYAGYVIYDLIHGGRWDFKYQVPYTEFTIYLNGIQVKFRSEKECRELLSELWDRGLWYEGGNKESFINSILNSNA